MAVELSPFQLLLGGCLVDAGLVEEEARGEDGQKTGMPLKEIEASFLALERDI